MHKFGFVEIPSKDIAASCEFYRRLFGWRCGSARDLNYGFFYTDIGINGGFSPNDQPGQGVIVYIETEDIDATLAKAVELGGSVAMPKTKVGESYGYIARFTDPCGNVLGLWNRS